LSVLLAKSPRGSRKLGLLQHLLETERAAASLFRPGTRWASSYLRFFCIPGSSEQRFVLHLRVAALFHDVGKANEDFQRAMQTPGFLAQSLRHEHLSALLLCHPEIGRWLCRNATIDHDVIVAAVLSHHLKAARDGDWTVLQPKHATPTRLYFTDSQVRAALDRVAAVAGLPQFDGSLPSERYLDPSWNPAYQALFAAADQFDRRTKTDEPCRRLMLATKAGLIAADSVASALWREEQPIEAWLEGVAHGEPLGPNDIEANILGPRKRQLGAKWKGWHRFQDGAANVGRRGLLLAACGAGKTLAAWRWAEAVSRSERIGRVIFLYPTRGTATEGFRDYVGHAPEGEAALVHGTSEYELRGMMENPPESLHGKRLVDENGARLFSLGLWDKRYFSATVDQFLGFIEHGYGGLCLLPALADSAIVFDEVHSYDPRMWNALVTFLERFDVPVLCMTATLPPGRRTQLVERGALRSYPSADDMVELRDLEELETHPRYRLRGTTGDEAQQIAVRAVGEGQRVLWVVNTVRRCQTLGLALGRRLGPHVPVGVYHSRFKLQDRQQRHRETIEAFRAPIAGEPTPSIAVTTQVCEMSLDLDADVLITEHAPISALVQRFGRANRHLRRGLDFRADLFTYAPEKTVPYEAAEVATGASFLAAFEGKEVSQRDLSLGLERYALAERQARGTTAFWTGGYFATAGMLRDSDDIGTPAILDEDVGAFMSAKQRREPTDGFQLTVPKAHGRPSGDSRLPTWIQLAESRRYDPWLGFVVDDDVLEARRTEGS